MAQQVQLRGGTSAQHQSFTGAAKEVTVDTDKHTLRVHDGVLAGGHEVAMVPDYLPKDELNFDKIVSNYTDGFFSTVSKNLFSSILASWYVMNNDNKNTYMTVADWKNGIWVCFSSFLSSIDDSKLTTLTNGVA